LFIKNPTAKKGTFIDSSCLSNNKTKARNRSTYSQHRSRKKKHIESTPPQPELRRKRKTNGNAILREKSTRTRTRSLLHGNALCITSAPNRRPQDSSRSGEDEGRELKD